MKDSKMVSQDRCTSTHHTQLHQGTATCTECVEAKSRSFTTTATTGNGHMHGMCRGEVTVFYHHRNNREQPHARNVSRRSHGLLPPPQRQGTATCTECVEAKSRVFTTTATTGNSRMHGMCRGEVTVFYHHRNDREQPHARNVSRRSHGLLPPPQQQGTATCTKVSRRSTSLLDQMRLPWGGFEPTSPRIRQDPGALPLSYHDLMSVRANF